MNLREIQLLKDAGFKDNAIQVLSRQYPSLHIAWESSPISWWMLLYVTEDELLDWQTQTQLEIIFAQRVLPNISRFNDKMYKISRKIINAAKTSLADRVGYQDIRGYKVELDELCSTIDLPINIQYAIKTISEISGNLYDLVVNATEASSDRVAEVKFQADTIRKYVSNPFPPEVERLELDKDTADPWKDILEEL